MYLKGQSVGFANANEIYKVHYMSLPISLHQREHFIPSDLWHFKLCKATNKVQGKSLVLRKTV